MPDDPAVQIKPSCGPGALPPGVILDGFIMVPAHKKQRDIQDILHILQVIVSQITASQYQIDISEPFPQLWTVDKLNNLIAQREHFHEKRSPSGWYISSLSIPDGGSIFTVCLYP